MGAPSLAELVLDRGYAMQELLKRVTISNEPDNLAAFVAINVALNELLTTAERRATESDQALKRRHAVRIAEDILVPKQVKHVKKG